MSYLDPYAPSYGLGDGRQPQSRDPRPRSLQREFGGHQRPGSGGGIQQLCPGCNVNVCSHYCSLCYPDNMLLMLCGQCSYGHIHPMRPLTLPRADGPGPVYADDSALGLDGSNDTGKRNSFHILEMECPHAKVASVIGTRGVVVKEINRRTGCFISINQAFPDGHPRIITLKGIYENVMEAKKMILSVIEHGPTALDPQKNFSMGPSGSDHPGSSQKAAGTSISVPCPLDKVGLVIGTRGAVIKEIIRRSKAHIFVAEETLLVGGEICRMIEISGTDKEVDMGRQLVYVVLQHGPNAMDMVSCPPTPPPSLSPVPGSNPGLSSGFTASAPEFLPESMSRPPALSIAGAPNSAFNSANTTPNSSSTSPAVMGFGELRVEVECPYEKVGVLIGFRGVVIKDIMHRSSTSVAILEESSGGFSRTVEIRGQRANVAHAKILVQAVIEFGATALTEEISTLTRAINEKSTKRSTPRPLTEIHRVDFPEDKIGLMIGSKGSMVKQIMNISGTKILISDRRSDVDVTSRVIEIKGDAESINVAKTLIESLINLEPHFQTIGFKNNQPSSGSGPAQTDHCMEMHLPADKVGLLIGSKGHVIKEIMRISDARISINADYTDEKIRIVLIRGSREAIVKAHTIMVDVLKNGYGRLFPSDISQTSHSDVSSDRGASMKSWPPKLEDTELWERDSSSHSVHSGGHSDFGGGGSRKAVRIGNRFSVLDANYTAPIEESHDFMMQGETFVPAPESSRRFGVRVHDVPKESSVPHLPPNSHQFSSGDTMDSGVSGLSKDDSPTLPPAGRSPLTRPRSLDKEVPFLSVVGDRGKRFSFADLLEEDGKGADNYWDKLLVEGSGNIWKSEQLSQHSGSASNSIDFDRLTPENSLSGTTGSRTPTDNSLTPTDHFSTLQIGEDFSNLGLSRDMAGLSLEPSLLQFSFLSKPDEIINGGDSSTAEAVAFSGFGDLSDTSCISIDIPCPVDKLGQIIGSRGSVIKEIGRRSGANVSVKKDVTPTDGMGQISVKAQTQESADAATELVLSVIELGPSVALDGVVCFKKVSPKPGNTSSDGESRGVASHPNRKAKISQRSK